MLQAKINVLDDFLKSIQLSKNDVLSHSVSTNLKDYPIINSKFGEDDIRSKVQVGWYAFAGGHFSPKKDAFPDCQGVIGIINDDPKAKEGNRVKVVLRHQKDMIEWCEEYIYTKVTNEDNGRENTRRLLEYGKKKGLCFPAMEFAQNYAFDGVKPGEAYVPAKAELKVLSKNYEVIKKALEQIGSSFNYYYWSSSEYSRFNAWYVYSGTGVAGRNGKRGGYAVSCLLDY